MKNNEADGAFLLLIIMGLLSFLFALGVTVWFLTRTAETERNRVEMGTLRSAASDSHAQEPLTANEIGGSAIVDLAQIQGIADFDAKMLYINPHFICWLYILGTRVNYPVVRGPDNVKYLDTTFFGEFHHHGALFMDYRNTGAVVPHIIIYGHNTSDSTKFGSLRYFLQADFLEAHPYVMLHANGIAVRYRIFAARETNVHDPAYFLDFSAAGSFTAFLERINAPESAAQILTLSTCLSRGDDDARLIVQAVLVSEE